MSTFVVFIIISCKCDHLLSCCDAISESNGREWRGRGYKTYTHTSIVLYSCNSMTRPLGSSSNRSEIHSKRPHPSDCSNSWTEVAQSWAATETYRPIKSHNLSFSTSLRVKGKTAARQEQPWTFEPNFTLLFVCLFWLLNINRHVVTEMGEKGARFPLRVRPRPVCLCAARRAVPRERPRLQGDVRPGRVRELLQGLHLQVCLPIFLIV